MPFCKEFNFYSLKFPQIPLFNKIRNSFLDSFCSSGAKKKCIDKIYEERETNFSRKFPFFVLVFIFASVFIVIGFIGAGLFSGWLFYFCLSSFSNPEFFYDLQAPFYSFSVYSFF